MACFGFADEASFITNLEQNPALKELAQRVEKTLENSATSAESERETNFSVFLEAFVKFLFTELDLNPEEL